jgi:hypothetical protein
MDKNFDEQYPNIAWWTQSGRGWIEVGRDEDSSSMIRVLDIGGMLWEGNDSYETAGEAMEEADEFIRQWRIGNGYAPE